MTHDRPPLRTSPFHIACVGYLNATPLVYGLRHDPAVTIAYDVPSGLLERLRGGVADVALLPTIDFQHYPDAMLLPVGGIGCDGPTLTVRLFSRVPFDQIRAIVADPDSHTSVVLTRIILQKTFGRRVPVHPRHVSGVGTDTSDAKDPVARLLIGDKVVCDEPPDDAYQLDLGEAWKGLTGLPFVFAAWAARPGVESMLKLGDWPARLKASRDAGLASIDAIVRDETAARGWPEDLARRYLTEYLRFQVGDREIEAIRRFHALAADVGAIASPPHPLRVWRERDSE